jgi:hypothetical protein
MPFRFEASLGTRWLSVFAKPLPLPRATQCFAPGLHHCSNTMRLAQSCGYRVASARRPRSSSFLPSAAALRASTDPAASLRSKRTRAPIANQTGGRGLFLLPSVADYEAPGASRTSSAQLRKSFLGRACPPGAAMLDCNAVKTTQASRSNITRGGAPSLQYD